MKDAQVGNHSVQYNAPAEYEGEVAEMSVEELQEALVAEKEWHGAWELLAHALHD